MGITYTNGDLWVSMEIKWKLMEIDNIRGISIYPHLSPLIPINLHQVKWKNINPHQSVLIPIAHLSNKS